MLACFGLFAFAAGPLRLAPPGPAQRMDASNSGISGCGCCRPWALQLLAVQAQWCHCWDLTESFLDSAPTRWMFLWQPHPLHPSAAAPSPVWALAFCCVGKQCQRFWQWEHPWTCIGSQNCALPTSPACGTEPSSLGSHRASGCSWGCAGHTCPWLGLSCCNSWLLFHNGPRLQLH